ncbi:MAG: HAD family hydrolase [Vicinamibacteria bacterium]|nr:HAD family hydrolase [Vicinamibacteria bacterium]
MPERHADHSPRAIQALIFDFDGLIVDTEMPIFEIWQDIFARHGHALALAEWQHALGTHGGFDPFACLGALTGRALDNAALAEEARVRHIAVTRAQPLLPGVLALLQDAARAGCHAAVASSSPLSWVAMWLQHHGIESLFGAVCAREDVRQVKPAPDLFLLAAERLGVPPAACLVLEDSPNGIRAAAAAGMRCVAIPNPLTRQLELPKADLVLESLNGITLADLMARVTAHSH